MEQAASSLSRVTVDGKFFRLDEKKFYVKGVAYGPFAPNAAGQLFASAEQTAADFAQIRDLGVNVIRIYQVPAKWFLDLAAAQNLKVLIDIPWNRHLCFLDSPQYRAQARDAVRLAVQSCARHPAVFAFSVANEIPSDIVRFNVYLHDQQPFRNYLARLQMLADSKPLLLGEFGIDSLREGEPRKCDILQWQIEDAFRAGLAGAVVYSFTDDWWRDGRQIEDWQMGLTTSTRQPKASFRAVQQTFQA